MMKRMVPILGRYGPFFFYSYTAILGSGLLLALGLTRGLARERIAPAWWHGVVLALAAGMLAGRAGFVASRPDYYRLHPGEIGWIWQGGLSYHAALPASLLTLWWWCRRHGPSPAGGPVGPRRAAWAAGWLACYLEGCAYGRETTLGWLAADLPDSFGVYAVRYQTQLLGAAAFLVLALAIWRARQAVRPAALFWLALALVSGARALLSLWRGDPVAELAGWRLDTVADGVLAIAAAALLLATAARRGSLREDE